MFKYLFEQIAAAEDLAVSPSVSLQTEHLQIILPVCNLHLHGPLPLWHLQSESRRGTEKNISSRLAEVIFGVIPVQGRDGLKYTVRASYLELYNEQIFDLLGSTTGAQLQLREEPKRGVHVEGLTEVVVLNGDRRCLPLALSVH
jgi:hypothetical protein